jgi:predicted HTH domain antitoxin
MSRYNGRMSVTVSIVLPEGAFSALRRSPAEFGEELKRAAVAKWYELGMVSQSKGAEILGVSRAELFEVLSQYKVSPFQVDEDEAAEASRG